MITLKKQNDYAEHNQDSLEEGWSATAEYTENALLIAFDGCHKIYLAMDEAQAKWFKENYNGRDCDDRTFEGTTEEKLAMLKKWYDDSCALKFIQAVWVNKTNPNAGFVNLISQGAEWEDEEGEEEYE